MPTTDRLASASGQLDANPRPTALRALFRALAIVADEPAASAPTRLTDCMAALVVRNPLRGEILLVGRHPGVADQQTGHASNVSI